jgi:hypothetical protein
MKEEGSIMKTKIFTLTVILFFLSIIPAIATDPGSLEKATVTVYTFSYSADYNVLAISGDGKKVGLADTYSGKVAISDVGGTSETVLVSGGEYGVGTTLALNYDGSVMVLESSTKSDGPGYLYMNTLTAAVTFIALGNYSSGYPCIDFDQGYYTALWHYFDYSDAVYSIRRYALETGTLLESIDIGANIDTPTKIYYLSDGRYCYMREGSSGYGIYYLPSGATDLSSEVLVQLLPSYEIDQWEASILYPQVVTLSNESCDTLNYYQPLDSAARTLFVDDSDYTHNNGCTILWMEMGLNSGFTFTSENEGKHIVQAYGDIPNQKGRYFTAEDLGYEDPVVPAYYNMVQRTKNVSDDGTRILVQVGHGYDYSRLTFLVAEVTGTDTETTTTTAAADTTTTTTVSVDTTTTTTSSGSETTTTTTAADGNSGELGGPCYGNGTCNTGLVCVGDICQESEEGTLGGPCYGNGTCNAGLECVSDVCVEATDNCSATYVLGEDDPRLDTIRRFRDEVLANNKIGKKLIEAYYNNDDKIREILDNYPAARKTAIIILESLVPAMELLLE